MILEEFSGEEPVAAPIQRVKKHFHPCKQCMWVAHLKKAQLCYMRRCFLGFLKLFLNQSLDTNGLTFQVLIYTKFMKHSDQVQHELNQTLHTAIKIKTQS